MLPFLSEIVLCFIVSYHIALLVCEGKSQRGARSNESRATFNPVGLCRRLLDSFLSGPDHPACPKSHPRSVYPDGI